MNGRNQQRLSTDRFRSCGDALEHSPSGGHVQAEGVLEEFSFGPFRIVPYARLLERDGSPMPLSSRAFDLLCLLVSRPGEIVSKGELLARVWPDVIVEESSLRFHITMLRRALGDRQGGERYVVNVPGRGYCFVACVGREASLPKQNHKRRTPGAPRAARTEWQMGAI